MQASIKTRAAFRTAASGGVLDYELTLDALDGQSSTVQLLGGDLSRDLAGGFLIIGGQVFLIADLSPGRGVTDLTLQDPLELFSRPRLYSAPAAGTTVGAFVVREIAAGWRDEPDAVYAMPYLQLRNQDTTPFVAPQTDDAGYYVLTDYLRTVRRLCGVSVDFSVDRDDLIAVVSARIPAAHVLAAGDGHTFLKTNTFSRKAVAKITTVQPVDTGSTAADGSKVFRYQSQDWYLSQDGAVSSTEPAVRAEGDWRVITVSEKNDAREAAEALFAKNTETHKLEFWTDFRPRVRDGFRLRLPSGEAFEGAVAAVSRSRGDRRWLIRAGSLAVTLTDKVRAAGSSSAGGSGGTVAQVYAVGDVFWTTRTQDPASLLGYGAWNRLTVTGVPSALRAWRRDL